MISSLELAKLCEVSQGTVDRALHNRKGISEKTKQKILEVAKEHGYQPHPAARELLTGKSRIVGAVIPQFNSVFYMDLLTAIKQKLTPPGFKLLISQYDSESELLELLADFSARRFRGTIIVPPVENLEIPENISSKMKIISLLSPVSGTNTCFISPDEKQTGIDAVDFLFNKGHRKIIHFTYPHPEYYAIRLRAAGYREAMKKHGLAPTILTSHQEDELLTKARSNQVDALFCHNDWLALSILRRLQTAGINVPEQISLLGVDNSPTFNALCPDLTTMAYPADWIATETLKFLTRKGQPSTPPRLSVIQRKT